MYEATGRLAAVSITKAPLRLPDGGTFEEYCAMTPPLDARHEVQHRCSVAHLQRQGCATHMLLPSNGSLSTGHDSLMLAHERGISCHLFLSREKVAGGVQLHMPSAKLHDAQSYQVKQAVPACASATIPPYRAEHVVGSLRHAGAHRSAVNQGHEAGQAAGRGRHRQRV